MIDRRTLVSYNKSEQMIAEFQEGSKMAKRNTKELILSESLKLFAAHGYDGVSVRDIAAKVGVKQSSLYKHFSSKKEVLVCIFADIKKQYGELCRAIQLPAGVDPGLLAQEYQAAGLDLLQQFSISIFLYWLTDEKGALFRRLLMLEQFRHSEAEQLLHAFLLDGALQNLSALFSKMIDNGYFCEGDPAEMALEFYAPFFLLLHKYDGQPERKEEAIRLIAGFIEAFDKNHRSEVSRL